MFSKTRLAAFMAVLLVAVVAIVVAGCGGGSGNSSSSSTTESSAGGGAEESSGGEKLTVGSDIPYPPFEQGKKGSYTGFDVELMEAIGKRSAANRNSSTPRSKRSSAMSPRASSKR